MRDQLLLAAMKAIPAPLARHLLFLLRSHPEVPDSWGHHIRPIHYYEPLPDFREIAPADTTRRRPPTGSEFNIASHLALMTRLSQSYGAEVRALPDEGYNFNNAFFDGLDAATYYALIRDLKPRRIVEIGSGFSTRLASRAMERNRAEGSAGEIVCVEPFPEPRLTDAKLPITLIEERVQRVGFDVFDSLQANDVLFIDSSHVATFGSDVCREFLEIVPRLRRGVWVQVHDIFFPKDYPPEWVLEQRRVWNEQYVLEAFLAFNAAFTPACSVHWLWSEHRDEMREMWSPAIVDAGGTQGPSSFWMTRTA